MDVLNCFTLEVRICRCFNSINLFSSTKVVVAVVVAASVAAVVVTVLVAGGGVADEGILVPDNWR